MDNLAAHKMKSLKRVYKKHKVAVFTNAAYTPQLNPIESLFAVVKGKMKKTSTSSR